MDELSAIRQLALKWIEGTITPEEKLILDNWYNAEYEESIDWERDASKEELKKRVFQSILKKIHVEENGIKTKVIGIRKNWYKVSAAAAILLFVTLGAYFILNKKGGIKPVAKTEIKTDIPPGHEGAILTLADGSKIILDSTQNGVITQQGNSNVVKNENALSYKTNSNVQTVVYNTMSTPNGRQYSLALADGSKVWLNAGSSIRFPSAFIGKERKVEVTGEVYFEVTKNPSMPFRVGVNDMTVEVLGTHFDINSYSDENAIKTTLLEGAVKVTKGDKVVKLTPGQQSVLEDNGALSVNKDVNTDEIMAWKDGYFHFESADLKTVLRQFARWYDVDVVYEGSVSDRKFFGIVKRNNTLKRVLEMLQDNNVAYRIEGRKLIVKGE